MLSRFHNQLRPLAWLEGSSLLLLLLIGIPLKYLANNPELVQLIGPIHGFFFSAYCLVLVDVHLKRRWSMKETSLFILGALLPFGTFVLDSRLKNNLTATPVHHG